MSTASILQGETRQSRLKWTGAFLAVLVLVVGTLYAVLFVRIVPPRSVRVVDAVTGKPLAGMNVCLQAVNNGWTKQALRSTLKTTDSNGRAFFFPSFINLALLQRLDGFSIHVTDPNSDFSQTCGPEVGLKMDPMEAEWPDKFAPTRTDGSKHFPVELVEREEFPDLPRTFARRAFMRGTKFQLFMSVPLIPVLDGPEGCKKTSDPSRLEECTRLNTIARGFADVVPVVQLSLVDLPPEIDSVTPETGVPGVTDVTIRGQHFGETQGNSTVSLGNRYGIVKRWTDTEIVATVAEQARRGEVSVWREPLHSNAIPFTPIGLFIDGISGNATPGNRIAIGGSGFGSKRGSGYVTIAGMRAQVVQWGSTEIIVTVPRFSSTRSTFLLAVHQTGKSAEFRLSSPDKDAAR